MRIHNRFNRKVWAFKSDFTGALAKWLVKQSPYIVPDKLSLCIERFNEKLTQPHKYGVYVFDKNDMIKINLKNLTVQIESILETIPEIMALNNRKNGRDGYGFADRYSAKSAPDDDFIDITAIAQNITCEFATDADAQCWLELNHEA